MKKLILILIAALFAAAPVEMQAQRVRSLREIMGAASRRTSSSVESCPFAWLKYNRVTYADIADMDGSDLRILRNSIFAMHGYIFKSADLRNYFKQFSWYVPRYKDVTRFLNKTEQYNVNFIRQYE